MYWRHCFDKDSALNVAPHDTGYCHVENEVVLADKQHDHSLQNSVNVPLYCQIFFIDSQGALQPLQFPIHTITLIPLPSHLSDSILQRTHTGRCRHNHESDFTLITIKGHYQCNATQLGAMGAETPQHRMSAFSWIICPWCLICIILCSSYHNTLISLSMIQPIWRYDKL